jgi:hypothetical protein
MWELTQRDLEFLTSLPSRWRMLYWRELARALAADALSVTSNAKRTRRVIGNPAVDLREWREWSSKPN